MILFYRAVGKLIEIIELAILIRVFISFIGIESKNVITDLIYQITEPIMSFSRNLIIKTKINTGYLDFSPIVAFIIMRVFYSLLGRVLF